MATTLSAGDIAIVGFNFDNPDSFAFVSLVDIDAGTEINFTDNGWQAAGTFRATEGTFTWTAPTNIAAGTVVNPALSSVLFSASGDQILAYQGDASNPTFIYALNSEGNGVWQSNATSSNTSALPTGLVDGETAVALNEIDNAIYTGTTSGTKAELLAAISDSANWSGDNSTRQTLPTNNFTVTGSGGSPTVVLDEPFNDSSQFTVTQGSFFNDGFADYFTLTDGSTIGSFVQFTGLDGQFLAAQDLNGEGGPATVQTTWSNLNISGLTNLSFSGLFAEDDDGTRQDWDANSSVLLEYSIDGGAFQNLLAFEAVGGTNTEPAEDTNFDGIGDGTTLTDAAQTFTKAIAGNGSSLDLRLTIANLDAGDEDIAVDSFVITGDSGGGSGTVVAIADVSQIEGNSGTSTINFIVTRSGDVSGTTTVDFTTADGTAVAGSDYTTNSGTITFNAGETTKTITVDVIGDAVVEADEAFTVELSNPSGGATLSPDTATGTILNDDIALTAIHNIQGSGTESPLVGQTVSTSGIVTKLLSNGFYLQTPDGQTDADATTSEGIFVFTGSAPTVTVGDGVNVTGNVSEFFGLTQVSGDTVTTTSTGNALPSAVQISLPGLQQTDLEAYEGMRFELVSSGADPLVIIENFNLDRFGEITVAEGIQTQATQIFDPDTQQTQIQNLISQNTNERLLLDDGNNSQNPTSFPYLPANVGDDGDGILDAGDTFSEAGPTVRLGSEVSNVQGVLSFGFSEYRLLVDDTITIDQASNEGSRPANAPQVGGDLKVASFNVLNYFTTIDVPGASTGPDGNLNPRGADTQSELDRQTDKLVAALVELDADVVGLQEIENNGTIAISTLVDELNAVVGAGTYAFVDPTGNGDFIGTDAITTGLIYKPSAVSVVTSDVLVFEEASAATTFALADVLNQVASSDDRVGDFQRNRPAVAATFQNADGERFTVAVNHFKSKGDSNLQDVVQDAQNALNGGNTTITQADIDALLADPNYDQGDGQGFWNQVRADAGTELAAWLTDTSANGYAGGTIADPDFLVIGDLNAYAQEDPVDAVEAGGFTDLIDAFAPGGQAAAYSFVFDGQRGSLDHALGTNGLSSQVTGVAEWHINADEPDLLNYDESFNDSRFFDDNLFGASDHDPLIIGLDLASAPPFAATQLTNTGAEKDGAVVTQWTKRTDVAIDLKDGITVASDVVANTLRGHDKIEGKASDGIAFLNRGTLNTNGGSDELLGTIRGKGNRNTGLDNRGTIQTESAKDLLNGKVLILGNGDNNTGLDNSGSLTTGSSNDSLFGEIIVNGTGNGNVGIRNSGSLTTESGKETIIGQVIVKGASTNNIGIDNSGLFDTATGSDWILGEVRGNGTGLRNTDKITTGNHKDSLTGLVKGNGFGIDNSGTIEMGTGNDTIEGESNDVFSGFTGGGVVDLGAGNDTIFGFGDQIVKGGTGRDTAYFAFTLDNNITLGSTAANAIDITANGITMSFTDVERFTFSNGVYKLSQLVSMA